MKPGRNDQCPCGSGKKYKKCCWGKASIPAAKSNTTIKKMNQTLSLESLLATYDRDDLLKTLAALQLEPRNHGKNIRFELLTQHVLRDSKANTTKLDYAAASNFFENNFQEHYMEDPASNFFTENTLFYGGDFIVYPGITTNGTRILNSYLECLFLLDNDLPKEFKDELFQGVMIVLALCDHAARRAGLQRNMYEESYGEPVFIPSLARLNRLKSSVTFPDELVKEVCKFYGIKESAIDEFIVDPKSVDPENYDPSSDPMLNTPFVRIDGEIVLLLPSAQVDALINFIKRKTAQYRLKDKVDNLYFDSQFHESLSYAVRSGMQLTDIKLPENKTVLGLQEAVLRFDNDKLAWLCFLDPSKRQTREKEDEDTDDQGEPGSPLRTRQEEVFNYLEKLNHPVEYKYLAIIVAGENMENNYLQWLKVKEGNYSVTLSFGDFQKIYFDGNMDGMTLWKFSKAFARAAEKMQFSMIDALDFYVAYTQNEGSFLPPDDAAPNFMVIAPGTGSDFDRDVFRRRDQHSALIYEKEELGHVPVIRHKQYAPIYALIDKSKNVKLLLEQFRFPLWITNYQAKNKTEKRILNDFVEAVTFWLFKLAPFISDYLNQLDNKALEIELKLDEKLFRKVDSFKAKEVKPEDITMRFSVSENKLTLEIPYEIIHLLILPDNQGERRLMENLFVPLNELLSSKKLTTITQEEIQFVVNEAIPQGNAKMLLFVDGSGENIAMDHRWLPPVRTVLETETSFVLDNLTDYLQPDYPIPSQIESTKEKNALCNNIVSGLIKRIMSKLTQFSAAEVVTWLIKHNEALIQEKEFREIQVPAKMACFSDFPTELAELKKKNKLVTNTSLAIRGLIEFVAAVPQWGNKLMNFDDLDELMAMMNEVVLWGIIADSIYLKMDDPEIGLLPSGRIGVWDSSLVKNLDPFTDAKSENELHDMVEGFAEKMEIKTHAPAEKSEEQERTDDAFAEEFAVTLTQMMKVMGTMMRLAIEKENSVVAMEESSLLKALSEKLPDYNSEILEKALLQLSLTKRDRLDKAPQGFDKDDIYPWKYNRSLSFRRRPVVKLLHADDSKIYYHWGFRHVMEAAKYLEYLLESGRLQSKKGGKLNAILSEINRHKGKRFRDRVKDWLKENTDLEVIGYEVTMNGTGHLKTGEGTDLGDIDVLAFDHRNGNVFPVECKNTVAARIIHEMKTEMDNYLGRDGEPGLIDKHVARYKWLEDNKDQVKKLCGLDTDIQIKPVVVTSNEVPTVYLAAEKIPLPMVSFSRLKRKGVAALLQPAQEQVISEK